MQILNEESPHNDEKFLSELPSKRRSLKFKNKSSVHEIQEFPQQVNQS